MGVKSCSDEEFIRLFKVHGAAETARILGIQERSVYKRRENLAKDQLIEAPSRANMIQKYAHRAEIEIKNGTVVIGSDFHIWPGKESTSLRAFKKLCKELKPAAVILNGDVLDFPQISRHPPIGWESAPDLKDEIEAAQDHLDDIVRALPRGCRKVWTLGNHDARFETRLATVAREYKGLKGIHLSDFFGAWEKGWSCFINNNVVAKHRFKGGVHAPYNNTLYAGMTMITGHLHSAKVIPFTDYRGTRWGVDTGCVADTDHKAFVDYTEDSPKSWVSGFGVLTFKDGELLWPELVTRYDDDRMQWRGEVFKV